MPHLKKVHLLKEKVLIKTKDLNSAFELNKDFAITLSGDILSTSVKSKEIIIFKGKTKQDLLQDKLCLEETNEGTYIITSLANEALISYNQDSCDYADLNAQGTYDFNDTQLEDMSWMLIDFDVTYKEMIQYLQDNTNITLLCFENELNILGYFNDIIETQKLFYTYAQDIIKDKLKNDPDFTYDYLDEDQKEAVEFFKAI